MNDKGISSSVIIVIVIIVILAGAGAYFYTTSTPEEDTGPTINVITYAGPESELITEGYYEEFEEETGINVEVDVFDEPTMRQKEIADFQSQTGKYDVIRTQFWHFPKFAQQDWLYPLDNYIQEYDVNLNNYPQGALDMYRDGGNLYCMPDSLLTNVLIYRKDIFDAENLEEPENTTELLSVLEEFKTIQEEQGKYEDMSGIWVRGYKSFDAYGSIGGWLWAYGNKFITENNNSNVYNQTNLEAMRDWVEMARKYGPEGQSTLGWVKGSQLYNSGEVLMESETNDYMFYVNDPEESDVVGKNAFATSPVGPADQHVQWSFGAGLGINKYSNNKEAAFKFLKWRVSENAYRKEIKHGIRLDMPYKPAYEWDIHQELAENWDVEEGMDVLAEAQEYATFEYWPQIPEFTEVAEAITSEISLAIAGDKSVEKALKDADAAVEDILRDAGYYE